MDFPSVLMCKLSCSVRVTLAARASPRPDRCQSHHCGGSMQGRPGAAAQCGWRAVQGRRSYVRGLPAAVDGPRTPAAISSQWGGRGRGRGRAAAASDSGVPGASPGAGGMGVRAAKVRAGPAQPSVPRAAAADWWHWRLARRASALAFGRCSAVGAVLCIHCILLDTLNIVWSR